MKRLKTAVPRRAWDDEALFRVRIFHRLLIMLATRETLANSLSGNNMEIISEKSKVDTRSELG